MKMNRQDPSAYELNYVTANRFYVEIDSQISACFSECSGLGINIKRETYNEGGVNDQQRIILGQAEFTEVTLKRGITNDLTFLNWIEKVLREPQKNPFERYPVTVQSRRGNHAILDADWFGSGWLESTLFSSRL